MIRTTPDSVPYAISIQLPPLIPTVSQNIFINEQSSFQNDVSDTYMIWG
jgi:hypothetical protein